MKKSSFGKQVVQYGVMRGWILGIFLVVMTFVASFKTRETGLAGTKNWQGAIEKASSSGDYETARVIWEDRRRMTKDERVLGVESEVEELVYPERKVQRVITSYEELNRRYPGHRDILLTLSKLYAELGNGKQAESYRGAARALDPNNPIFQP